MGTCWPRTALTAFTAPGSKWNGTTIVSNCSNPRAAVRTVCRPRFAAARRLYSTRGLSAVPVIFPEAPPHGGPASVTWLPGPCSLVTVQNFGLDQVDPSSGDRQKNKSVHPAVSLCAVGFSGRALHCRDVSCLPHFVQRPAVLCGHGQRRRVWDPRLQRTGGWLRFGTGGTCRERATQLGLGLLAPALAACRGQCPSPVVLLLPGWSCKPPAAPGSQIPTPVLLFVLFCAWDCGCTVLCCRCPVSPGRPEGPLRRCKLPSGVVRGQPAGR
jgi:hypothetical protein